MALSVIDVQREGGRKAIVILKSDLVGKDFPKAIHELSGGDANRMAIQHAQEKLGMTMAACDPLARAAPYAVDAEGKEVVLGTGMKATDHYRRDIPVQVGVV